MNIINKAALVGAGLMLSSLVAGHAFAVGVANDRMDAPGASFHNEAPVKKDSPVSVTSGKTYLSDVLGHGVVTNDSMGRPGASFKNEGPARKDPVVSTTSGKTYGPYTGINNDSMS